MSAFLTEKHLIVTGNVTEETPENDVRHAPVLLLQLLDEHDRPSLKVTWDVKRAKSKHML